MAMPDLPARFPCFVKAVYSWGGESKRDLGFIEGDIIECLNAGDGSWWTGRLLRDKRSIGSFPSNFVRLMPDDWQPYRKASINEHSRTSTPASAPAIPSPQKPKGVFRKPFQAYGTVGAKGSQSSSPDGTPSPPDSASKKWKPMQPYSSMKKIDSLRSTAPARSSPLRAPSPTIPKPVPRGGQAHRHSVAMDRPVSRAPSPLPPNISRAASPNACMPRSASPNPYAMRAASPQPYYSRAASPQPCHSRAPSPQPHHSRAASPQPFMQTGHISRATSPRPSLEPMEPQEPDIPLPSTHQLVRLASREPSPVPFEHVHEESPPPPPPPAHRVAYSGHMTPRIPSPSPSGHSGMTPSPLRDAMNDVMTSLEGMGVHDSDSNHDTSPPTMWGPDDYEIVRSNSAREGRPHTSIGFGVQGHSYDDGDQDDTALGMQSDFLPRLPSRDGPPQLNNYVQRMEERLKRLQQQDEADDYYRTRQMSNQPPSPPEKNSPMPSRHGSSARHRYGDDAAHGSSEEPIPRRPMPRRELSKRKSAIELGRAKLQRTFTNKSNTTNASSTAYSTSTNGSSGTQLTNPSLMSGHSAGGFSATSAGSLARRKFGRSNSIKKNELQRPATAMSSISYASGHETTSNPSDSFPEPAGVLGGFSAPVAQKRGFFRKIIDSAKTTAASSRSHIPTGSESRPSSRAKSRLTNSVTAIAGGRSTTSLSGKDAAREMGLGSGPASSVDWVQMRRDVNRSNSLSENEKRERYDRCQMMDFSVLAPTDIVEEIVQGDEDADGRPILSPTDFLGVNLSLVDKGARFITNLPPGINPISLAQNHLCRQYRSDVQKLRAIFTWVSERVGWEDEYDGEIDAQRVLQAKRGCSEEIAVLVAEMCAAIGIHAEIVRGYLKHPEENLLGHDLNDVVARPNHWWNAVLVDGEWRIMDCALANPSYPRRSAYSVAGPAAAESWYFLARPTEICYSHVPLLPEQQHVIPPMPHDILMSLPIGCPAFFKNEIRMHDFNTSLLHLDGLEMAHIHFAVPDDVECVAEVEARSFARDADGDFFESGDLIRKRALAQAEFVSYSTSPSGECFKQYTVKAVLPSTPNASSTAVLKVYAGKRGLMHSIGSNPHAIACSLPLMHEGQNPEYDFFLRHPTPHALRNELYVTGPLCKKLAVNNTFVFGVRQHPGTPNSAAFKGPEHHRPGSAMSMASVSASGSSYSNPSATGSESSSNSGSGAGIFQKDKPAKLAIQSPSGKIMRMTRKVESNERVKRGGNGYRGRKDEEDELPQLEKMGSSWEIVVKITERGTWRGLVLADRSARWCVFGEWDCV